MTWANVRGREARGLGAAGIPSLGKGCRWSHFPCPSRPMEQGPMVLLLAGAPPRDDFRPEDASTLRGMAVHISGGKPNEFLGMNRAVNSCRVARNPHSAECLSIKGCRVRNVQTMDVPYVQHFKYSATYELTPYRVVWSCI